MDPMTMMMLAKGISGGIPALAQAGLGVWQGVKANKMAKDLHDPIYDIPDSAEDALGLARTNAGSRMMSGQTHAQQKIDQQYANTAENIMESAGSSTDALGALVKANAGSMGAQNELEMKAAQDYQSRQRDLASALSMMAGYEDKKFKIDVLDKFDRDSAAVSAMKNAAINNVFGGIKSGSKTAGDMMSTKAGGMGGLGGMGGGTGGGQNDVAVDSGVAQVGARGMAVSSANTDIGALYGLDKQELLRILGNMKMEE